MSLLDKDIQRHNKYSSSKLHQKWNSLQGSTEIKLDILIEIFHFLRENWDRNCDGGKALQKCAVF